MPCRGISRGLAATLAVLLAFLVSAARAAADAPLRLDEQVTDNAEALGERRAAVQAALDRLRDQHGLQLFVAYVHSFDGASAQRWADQTAERSDLGLNDALLAVATRDRAYAYSVDSQSQLTDQQLATVATVAIEPALAANDWPAAAIGAADGYAASLSGRQVVRPTITPGPPDTTTGTDLGMAWLWGLACLLLLIMVVAALLVWWWLRRARRPVGSRPTGDPLAGLPTEELAKRANARLVEIDDALKTSEQELGFAVAAYGQAATAEFAAALAASKADTMEAFRIRAILYDATPEDEAAQRAMFGDIIHRCEAADQRLDAQAESFDQLRALESRVDAELPTVLARRAALADRMAIAATTLEALADRYAPSAYAPVAGNVTQAEERLSFAADALGKAENSLAAADRSAAAVAVHGAQQAVAQAETLLAAIEARAADLDGARAAIGTVLSELDGDMAQARAASASATPDVSAALELAVTRAEQVAAQARTATQPHADPLALLRQLRDADAELDRELAQVRETAARVARARQLLEQALLAARAEIGGVSDYITTRRGAVGSQARTRLAEAQQRLDLALSLQSNDPVTALAEARQADALAEQAGRLARDDVANWSPGGMGGHADSGGGLSGIGGAVLGGILLDTVLRGGMGGGWHGRVPGSFGGMGTRARRGGGGRF